MTMKKLQGMLAAAAALGAASLGVHAYAQQPANGDIHILKVQGNVYMLVGDGANIAASVGKDGVFLVDGGTAQLSDKLLATLKTLSEKPVHYIVNTSVDADHVGGNGNLARNGAPVLGGNLGNSNRGAAIVARENVLTRMSSAPSGQKPAFTQDAWPTVTWFEGNKEIFFNSEAVVTMPADRAHTDGDSIVYFRRSDVIAAGDVFRDDTFPVVDLDRGGNINGVIDGLNHILDLAIPEHEQEGGTYIIPGHGRLTDEHDVLEYRDMVTIVRDRVEAMIKKGMTLDQVKAAKPTFEYDKRWSAPSGLNSTNGFVEAVYKSLKK
jgi:glyoxylase-like metal-dependent hydrolase (beta-lactamase superfamily II)